MKTGKSGMPGEVRRALRLAFLVLFVSIFCICSGTGFQAFAQDEGAPEAVEQSVDKPADKEKVEEKAEAAEEVESTKDEPVVESDVESDEEIISISDALKQGQIQHEKNLVDKFLLGIAILFLVIAFLLFNSLPPSSPESN